MSSRYHIYGMGNALLDMEFNVDITFFGKHQVQKGLMTLVDQDRQHELMHALGDIPDHHLACGGSAANSMIIARYLGAEGFYTCKIANDKAGDFYYKDMKKAGLDNTFDHKGREDGLTGKCLVMVTPDADRTMNTFLGISESLSVAQLHEPALLVSDYLYIEGYLMTSPTALGAVKQAYATAKANGVKTAISLSDPFVVGHFRAQFNEILSQGVDLVFANEEEALSYTNSQTLSGAIAGLQAVAKAFVITRGPHGSIVFDGGSVVEVEPMKVEAIDMLGAGDMYAGAFLAGVTKYGMSMQQAGELANAISAKVVTQYGPRISQNQASQILTGVREQVRAIA